MKRPAGSEKTAAETGMKKNLMGLLRSGDLSPEEHKKILEIATSVGRAGVPAGRTGAGTRLGKAILVVLVLAAAALVVAAFIFLDRMSDALRTIGPRPGKPDSASPGGSSGDTHGPGE